MPEHVYDLNERHEYAPTAPEPVNVCPAWPCDPTWGASGVVKSGCREAEVLTQVHRITV